MTLEKAIEEVKKAPYGDDWEADEFRSATSLSSLRDAIATILNAVVKGELKE